MGTNDIRVIIADTDENTRQLLSRAIARHPRLRLLAACASVRETRERLAEHHRTPRGVDILVTEMVFPDGEGGELLSEPPFACRGQTRSQVASGTQAGGGAKTLVYSSRDDEASVLAAIEQGAGGYVLKHADTGNVVNAMLQLAEGGAPVSPSLTAHLLKRCRRQPTVAPVAADGTSLTGREQEVLTYIAKGLSYGEISALLRMSRHTVTSHVRHIYRKLAVGSRGEAVYEAMQMGLLRMAS